MKKNGKWQTLYMPSQFVSKLKGNSLDDKERLSLFSLCLVNSNPVLFYTAKHLFLIS